ncbi:DUF397 domain-containing protein [Streptomyces bohaiensis]|uniref:DUF397 domain-containing protein n=1 Tax=Streptomyces bohaiensis TaxID=1431344 RepID=A0ABX1C987_9ACTN|nr:DUF397 domain-containing protein [Streptomyces bohaiensis]NJQ15696.1 DUF397 domain-containing protein [Streptomyces bohaiensis]
MTAGSPEGLRWFSSSYSNNGGDCVEVAAEPAAADGIVPVRDSKAPSGAVLMLPSPAFAAFVGGLCGGRLA